MKERCFAILQSWIDELRWQRLAPFQKLAHMLVDHLDGILNYCRTKVRFGVVQAINANMGLHVRDRYDGPESGRLAR
jgi:transposase